MKKIILGILICFIGLISIYLINNKSNINKDLHIYKNENMGYEIGILKGMYIDNSLSSIVTNISNENISIDVFYDDFENTLNDYDTYTYYSNKVLKESKYHNIIEETSKRINGMLAHILVYSRDKLSKVSNDKNYYCSAEIKASNRKVYTILAKTNSKNNMDVVLDIVNSFKIIGEVKDTKIPDGYFKNVETNKDSKTKELYTKYFSDEAGLTWGIFEPKAPSDFTELDEIEDKIDYDFKFLIRYQSLNTALPMEEIKKAADREKVVELSLQTMNTVNGEVDIYEILDGKYDEYFNQYAKDIKSLDTPILFRLNNEMNGDWCGYSAYYFAKDASLYKEAWKVIYNIFEANEVKNVLWVWNPNHKSFPDFAWNNALMYYPGDEYVDIVGLTAYNTGNYYEGEKWSSFDELYLDYYNEYARIFNKPLMITEFGSSIFGGDKIDWVNDMFNNLYKYPRIKVAIWWSHIDYDIEGNEARVYKIDRPGEILDIFKRRK